MLRGSSWVAVRFALRDLTMRKFAAALTILAVASGIAVLTALRLSGIGVRLAAERMVQRALAGEILVYGDGPCDLSEVALEKLEKVPGVKRVVPLVVSLGYVRGSLVLVIGVRASDLDVVVNYYSEGRSFTEEESWTAVVDLSLAEHVGVRTGDSIVIKTQVGSISYPFSVVGVGDVTIELYGLAGVTSYVVVPLRDAQRMLGREGYVTLAMLMLEENVSPDAVETMLKTAFPGARAFRREEIMRVVSEVLSLMNALVTAASAVGLAAAVMGTANTVMSNVREHTSDIAVLRTLGAKRRHIILIFVLEGATFGIIGGVLGLALGILGADAARGFFQRVGISGVPLVLDIYVLASHVALAICVGAVSALYPAIKASNISPTRVLKGA